MRGLTRLIGLVGLVLVVGAFGDSAPAADAADAVLGSSTEISELRIQTDRTRTVDGREQAVYDLKKPKSGNTFVTLRLYVSSDGGAFTVKAGDVAVRDAKDPDGMYLPFDWFHEDGLVERRGDSLSIQDAGIINATVEVPAANWQDLTVRFQGQDVSRLGGKQEKSVPLTSTLSRETTPPVAPPLTAQASGEQNLHVVVSKAQLLSELRVQTDRTRVVDGQTQVVYENRKPKTAHLFVNVQVQVASDGQPATFTAEDLRLVVPGSESGPWVPFDWFREDGLKEARGASLTLTSGILEFTIELPRDVERTARLMVKDQDLGLLADLLP